MIWPERRSFVYNFPVGDYFRFRLLKDLRSKVNAVKFNMSRCQSFRSE